MFTGLIQEIGTVKRIRPGEWYRLGIHAKKIIEGIELGDSISVNGACLTVVTFDGDGFEVDAMPETIEKTTLKYLKVGSRVNLEPSLRLGDKVGGHWVTGHVDGTGTVLSTTRVGNSIVYEISLSEELAQYLIPKGSIAVDGISLTIIECGPTSFKVGIIPHTLQETILDGKGVGSHVNLETDFIGKYVYKYTRGSSQGGVTEDRLRESGFM